MIVAGINTKNGINIAVNSNSPNANTTAIAQNNSISPSFK